GEDCEINSLCKPDKAQLLQQGCHVRDHRFDSILSMQTETALDLQQDKVVYICTFDKCLHGKCEVVGLGYRCKCDDGYTGHRCETKIRSEFNLLHFVVLVSTNAVIILFASWHTLSCMSQKGQEFCMRVLLPIKFD
ncbi:hypothetical protein CEXT_439521, partial [Caerostris extrusa]